MADAKRVSKDDTACPFCAEKIDRDATRCHWCRREVAGLMPTHGDRCPACLQKIEVAALLCRHCGESFVSIEAIIGSSLAVEQRSSGYTEKRPCSGCGGGTAGIFAKSAQPFLGKSVQPVVAGSDRSPDSNVVSVPLGQLLRERSLTGPITVAVPMSGGRGGVGVGGLNEWECSWSLKLVPCDICIPGTSICWGDYCFDLTLDCSGSIRG
jgi:hypothetical protein